MCWSAWRPAGALSSSPTHPPSRTAAATHRREERKKRYVGLGKAEQRVAKKQRRDD